MSPSQSQKPALSSKLLVVHSVLITLIVVGSVLRFGHPFIYNPLDSLFSDPARHFHNAYDVKGEDLASILNAPGFELFLTNVVRITGKNATLIAMVFGALSVSTPYFYYRWFRELTGDKTIALLGYAMICWLPSYLRIFAYFMDSTILLPLTALGLWLTWRAARKLTWNACWVAAIFCGAACCTKSVALPVTVLPWTYVAWRLWQAAPRPRSLLMAAGSVAIVLAIYGLGPLKVWSHTGAFVLMPDGIYNARYFESGAHDIEVTSSYRRFGDGDFVSCAIWGSSSVCYPPFYPFSNWISSRQGRFKMDLDYMHGRDYIKPINMTWQNRVKYTFENIIYFFFEYQWPEDNDWQDPFPRNVATLVRWVWFPLTVFLVPVMLATRRREFMTWYFCIVTLAFMLQQSAVMEGRYKKLWEAVAVGALLNVVATSRAYKNWKSDGQPSELALALPSLSSATVFAPPPPQPDSTAPTEQGLVATAEHEEPQPEPLPD